MGNLFVVFTPLQLFVSQQIIRQEKLKNNVVILGWSSQFSDAYEMMYIEELWDNKSFIEDESQISESTLLYKILSHKADISNNLYHIAPHILDNTEQLCEYLLNCGVLIGVGLHKSDVIYVGKIREITATSFLLNSYDTELSESGIKRIDFEKIRYIQIHTDYLDSLSMIL